MRAEMRLSENFSEEDLETWHSSTSCCCDGPTVQKEKFTQQPCSNFFIIPACAGSNTHEPHQSSSARTKELQVLLTEYHVTPPEGA